MLSKIIDFFTTDIWRIRVDELPRTKSFLLKQLRIVVLAVRGFDEDKCSLKASSLTFYTLLSIVPVAAMAFGIAKGFGFEALLEKMIIEKLQGQEEIIRYIITFSHSLLENTKGGLIAGIGIAVLFWSVIKLLGNIEKSFNDIWGIRKNRKMGRMCSDYLSAMLICPVLFIMASSLTVVISGQIKEIVQQLAFLKIVSPLVFSLLNLLPYCVVWILFIFIYMFMPNTSVRIGAGVLGGIAAGTLYQILQWGYITFQVNVSKYNAIYGGFAALPLFLVWLELSWLIVLLGAEISFAYQNVDTYEFEPDCLNVSYSFKKLLTLSIVHLLVKNFERGDKPLASDAVAHALEIPARLTRQILYELVSCGLLCEVAGEGDRDVCFQPGLSITSLSIQYVLERLEQHGSNAIPIAKLPEHEKIAQSLESLGRQIAQSPENVCLKDI